jgi:beta-lactam-binding protein with PASTA domain
MPSLTGLTLAGAAARAAAAGLHIASVEDINLPAPTAAATPAATAPTPPSPTEVPSGTVVDQSPLAGYRVIKGESVRITLTH